ncbi:MAG: hypothetical protein ACXVJ7_02665 [Acidimicrobiia bacterium]
MAVQAVQGRERVDATAVPPADPTTARHRYSVDELHALAHLHGRAAFPGVPDDSERLRTPREHTIVTDVVMRSLAARGVIHVDHRIPIAPYDLPIDVILTPELTCSVQRYRRNEVTAYNCFIRYGLLVEQSSPAEGVIELATRDVRDFGNWLAAATGWRAEPARRAELRQVPRTVRVLRGVFNHLATGEPASLNDHPVLDAGHVVISRHRGPVVDGVDLAWITTTDTRWVFTHATDVLFGFGRSGDAEVMMQAATDSELTRAILKAVRPIALSTAQSDPVVTA